VASYRLTVRHGPKVERETFEMLDDALEALERHAEEVRREGPLEEFRVLRDFEPAQRVHARIELSTGGAFRGREVGIDVMGDGALVPYAGVIRKRRLEPSRDRSAFDAVREALTG
jgi:hypothetical protein